MKNYIISSGLVICGGRLYAGFLFLFGERSISSCIITVGFLHLFNFYIFFCGQLLVLKRLRCSSVLLVPFNFLSGIFFNSCLVWARSWIQEKSMTKRHLFSFLEIYINFFLFYASIVQRPLFYASNRTPISILIWKILPYTYCNFLWH